MHTHMTSNRMFVVLVNVVLHTSSTCLSVRSDDIGESLKHHKSEFVTAKGTCPRTSQVSGANQCVYKLHERETTSGDHSKEKQVESNTEAATYTLRHLRTDHSRVIRQQKVFVNLY